MMMAMLVGCGTEEKVTRSQRDLDKVENMHEKRETQDGDCRVACQGTM